MIATGTGHDGLIGPHFNALGADWVIFLAAARAIFSHDLSHIYDQAWITNATNSQFAHWLSPPLPFPLFPYPPLSLLLLAGALLGVRLSKLHYAPLPFLGLLASGGAGPLPRPSRRRRRCVFSVRCCSAAALAGLDKCLSPAPDRAALCCWPAPMSPITT